MAYTPPFSVDQIKHFTKLCALCHGTIDEYAKTSSPVQAANLATRYAEYINNISELCMDKQYLSIVKKFATPYPIDDDDIRCIFASIMLRIQSADIYRLARCMSNIDVLNVEFTSHKITSNISGNERIFAISPERVVLQTEPGGIAFVIIYSKHDNTHQKIQGTHVCNREGLHSMDEFVFGKHKYFIYTHDKTSRLMSRSITHFDDDV